MRAIAQFVFRPVTLVGLVALAVLAFAQADVWVAILLIVLSFGQNVAYSLQSRASTRTSNLYHLLASVLASLVFFATLRLLILSDVTLLYLAPYILGTMLGSVLGTKLSIWIEARIGAIADLGKEAKGQTLPLFPAVLGLLVILALQFSLLQEYDLLFMAGIALVAFGQNYLFSVLRAARSTDSYWFHMGVVLIHGGLGFLTYSIMVGVDMNWYLFGPYVTGTLIGNMTGAESGKRFGNYLKASWDAHVLSKDAIVWPTFPVLVALALLVPQVIFFGGVSVGAQVAIFGAALLQNCAFSIVSRARQRGHMGYIEWSSVFSNGIWFYTLNILVVGNLAPHLILPYLSGTAIGSLWGQGIAMKLEQRIGALMVPTAAQK